MGTALDNLVAKLRMLGNKVKIVNDSNLIATDGYTGKMRLITIEDCNVEMSQDFDDIQQLPVSEYYLVRNRKSYGLTDKHARFITSNAYSSLERPITTSVGKYNLVARLSNGLYGVIDVTDSVVIPFEHYQIKIYKTNRGIIYVGYNIGGARVYTVDGSICNVSNIIGMQQIIVCEEYMIICSHNTRENKNYYRAYSLEGNLIPDVYGDDIINFGTYLQIMGGNKVVVDKVQLASKILRRVRNERNNSRS